MKKTLSTLLFILSFIVITSTTFAQSPEITNGLNYLYTTQNPDGSWDSNTADVLPATTSVIETLQVLNETSSLNYSDAVLWLQYEELNTTDYLSERIYGLLVAGTDRDVLLSYLDELEYAWGGYDDFEANNLDTTLALQALKAINHPDLETISYALGYLISTQNDDGDFGFSQGDDASAGSAQSSNVYMTALVTMTLQQFSLTVDIATAINRATDYLINQQQADGSWGPSASSGSTVYETALAYIALVSVTTDTTILGNAVNHLTAAQLTNGSWNDDPYSTALAIRALHLSENRPEPPPEPTTGTITGTVIDASTGQALGQVTVISGQLSATTTNTGEFTLSDMPSGSQTITFSLNGYATATVTVDITAGSFDRLRI